MDTTPLQRARDALVNCTNKTTIDLVLASLSISHEEYRKHYPDTPPTVALAYDIMEHPNLTNSEIATKWNLSTSQLHYVLYNDEALYAQGPSKRATTRRQVELALKEQNQTQTQIADKFGVSQSYVHKLAKKLGVLSTRKARVELTKEDWEAIIKATEHTRVEELAIKYNVARDTIYKRLRLCKNT